MRILISGGGIAGLASAFWLGRRGVDLLIIEKAARFEPLGHFIALKAKGVEVIREMGLLDVCRKREASIRRIRYLTSSGKLLREADPADYEKTLGGYIFFRRADLHLALYEALEGKVEIRYGTEVENVLGSGEGVTVSLSGGRVESADLLLGADGVHSRTRRLVFGEGYERPIGGRYIALTVDGTHRLEPGCLSVFLGWGQQVALGAVSPRSVSGIVYHGDGGLEPRGKTNSEIKSFLIEAYAKFPRDVCDFFEAIDEGSFIFTDTINMVRMPSLVSGRVALIGDAGYCPTFMSGMGSALALQGARTFADSLGRSPDDVSDALAEYERSIVPIARGFQQNALKAKPVILGRNALPNLLRNAVVRFVPGSFLRKRARRFYQA